MTTPATNANPAIPGNQTAGYDPAAHQYNVLQRIANVQTDSTTGEVYGDLGVDVEVTVNVDTSAAQGYVAAYGSNASALTSATDYLFKWGAGGTTAVNHVMIQNNTAANLNYDLDVAATAGSPVLAPGQTIFFDVITSVVHLYQSGTPNVNGSSAANIVVRGWL